MASMHSITVLSCAGSFAIRPVLGSRMEEILVGVYFFTCLSREVGLNMDFRAFLGFL